MASANFLEEALSTDVDELAVSAIVGSLENHLVTSAPSPSTASAAITTGIKNHVNSAVSNGGSVSSQKLGLSLPTASSNINISLNDASQTNTVQTCNLGQVKVVAPVAGEVTNRPNFVNQVTSSIGLTQTTLSNLIKGQESVRILYSSPSQVSGGMNANTRLPLTTQHVGALQNGNVALTSLPTQTVVNPATTIISQSQLPSSTNVTKQIPQTIGVINALEQAKAAGSALVIKANSNQLGSPVTIASAVMPVPMSVNTTVPMTATSINSVATGTGTAPATSGTSMMTLSKPIAQAVGTVGSQSNVISGNVQILNVCRPSTPGVVGQKGPSRVVIGGPLVGSRPGTPGQITLQALQGLQSGTQSLLLKTENGQFQLLRVGPAQSGSGSNIPAGNSTTPVRIQSFPIGSVAVAGTTPSTTGTASSIQGTPVPVPALTTPAPATVVQTQPRPAQVDTTKDKCRKFLANLLELSSREPKVVEKNVRSLIQELVDCKVEPEEFCERLERLLNASPQPCLIGFLKKSLPLLRQAMVTKELVIEGIRPPPANVVFSTATTPTSHVVSCPPLQATQIRPTGASTVRVVTPMGAASGTAQTAIGGMPAPRHMTVQHRLVTPIQLLSAVCGTFTGTVNKILTQAVMTPQVPITTAAPAMVSQPVSTTVVTSQPSPVASPAPTPTLGAVPVSVASTTMIVRPGAPGPLPIQTRTLMSIKPTATTIRQPTPIARAQSPIVRPTTPIRLNTPLAKTTTIPVKMPPKLTPTQIRMQGKVTPGVVFSTGSPISTLTSEVGENGAICSSTASHIPAPAVIPSQTILPISTSTSIASGMAPLSSVSTLSSMSSTSTVIPTCPPPASQTAITSSSLLSKAPQKEKEKKSSSSTNSAMYTGDDDINDVAAMGGVNIVEETQRILGSTEFVGTQIRSCKDDIFLHGPTLQQKIRQVSALHGLEESAPDVAALISHATQERLKNLVEKLAVIAEHRMDVIKLDPRYEVTQDVKGQLKFLEELDRMERKRHEEKERELLLRAAKSRSKSEDPEQAKLKAKAKEMQRAEMEEVRQREANMTALQAIGPRKKPRLDGPLGDGILSSTGDGASVNSNGNSLGRAQLPSRPRLKRVNLRDLVFLLEQEKESCRSTFLYRAYLK